MFTPNKIIAFLFLLQIHLLALGQSRNALHAEISNQPVQKINASVKVNDIPATTTAPPNISYRTPNIFALNKPIIPLTPNNSGGSVPATIYGETFNVAGLPGFQNLTGIIAETDGSIYAANYGRNNIYKVTPAGAAFVFAGATNGDPGQADGQGTNARFSAPDALVRDAAGNIYVSDMGYNLIRKIAPDGTVSTFAGNGTAGSADNATGTIASFNAPRGLTRDADGNIYVADQGNNLIRKISPNGAVTTVAGRAGMGFTNGNTANATFNTPTAVGIDDAGNLYISDSGNAAVRKITPTGTVSTVATGLRFPRELRVDGSGTVYVVEQDANRVIRLWPNGTSTVVAGGFNSPIGLAFDGKGNLFVGAVYNIHRVVISGYTIDKAPPPGFIFDGKTGTISGTPTSLWPPTDYYITGYNGGGNHTTTVSIAVQATVKLPSIITLPAQQPDALDADNNYDPKGTSTNPETPIVYTSNNPAVATITPGGLVHLVGPGLTVITATQAGNANYSDASPVIQNLTVTQRLYVDLPPFQTKTICSADFSANAFIGDNIIPVAYTSSNPAVATISAQGLIHVTGAGTTVITISQNSNQQYYISAQPKSQTLTVNLPVMPTVSITSVYEGQCNGALITFTATGQNAGANSSYQWRINNVNVPGNNANIFASSTLQSGDKVSCVLSNNDSACLSGFPATSNTIEVSPISPVTPTVNITASANYVFPGTKITFTANVQNGNTRNNYQWYVNGVAAGSNTALFESNEFNSGDMVKCVVEASNSCSVPAESNVLRVDIISKIEIPNTFTPNGDGINDTWFIKGLASYPNCLLSIYSRQGQLLYQSKGYNTEWNGTASGKYVPAATYYYVIDLQFQNKLMSGYVTILK